MSVHVVVDPSSFLFAVIVDVVPCVERDMLSPGDEI